MEEFKGKVKLECVWTEQDVRELRDYCKLSQGDDFDEEIFQEELAKLAAENTAELQALGGFYDEEIERKKERYYGLESELPEPVIN